MKYKPILNMVPLFEDIHPDDQISLLQCLEAKEALFAKGTSIWTTGDKVDAVGILLNGSLQILKDDAWGNRVILTEMMPGSIFGEAFICAGMERSPVSVLATVRSEVLFIRLQRIIHLCTSSCTHHQKMIANLLKILAHKSIFLNERVVLLSQRSIRDRLLAYLFHEAEKQGSLMFSIRYSRNEMADYLCVDRSALSRELSKMQKQGLLSYEKNHFKILSPDHDPLFDERKNKTNAFFF